MKKIIGVFILITAGALFFKIDGKSEEVELKYYETYTVKKQNT